MKNEGKLCPQNFQIWVAFLMGMVVIIIAIVAFDAVSIKGRMGSDVSIPYQGVGSIDTYGQSVSYANATEDESRAWLGIEPTDVTEIMARLMLAKTSTAG